MNRLICVAAFVAGIIATLWIGIGYVGSSLLGLVTTALIGAVYLAGTAELLRFHRGTQALLQALSSLPTEASPHGDWLASLPPSLRNPARLRLEGERAPLPGPAVTPYLVGLLVLLGMLGTFLGMVVTLNGAVLALEGTTSLQAIRAALSAPVKGLGVAFGTSVAGVAASAMLGLLSALCRRARMEASQLLDSAIATTLRPFSVAQQRQDTLEALQRQSQALPELIGTLQTMMAQMAQQSRELNERLADEQSRFYRDASETYGELARSVGASLKESLVDSARLAGETITPAVQAAMDGIARETTALQTQVASAVQTQLDGIAARFDRSLDAVSDHWSGALANQQQTSEHLVRQLESSLERYADTFEQRSARLLDSVDSAHASLRTELASTARGLAQDTGALHTQLAAQLESRLEGVAGRLDHSVSSAAETLARALSAQQGASERLTTDVRHALQSFSDTFTQRAAELVQRVGDTTAALQTELASRDDARHAALASRLESMAATLQQEWQQVGADALARQQTLVHTLGDTAREVAASAQAQASGTIAEVARLMETAAQAPRAAAEVIGELRHELSASIARDNELLAERSRIMETLGALLDAINHASTEQRTAIDALVASSSAMLDRAGTQFAEQLTAQSARMAQVSDQVSVGAVEVACLGEAFNTAVHQFGESSDKLMTSLARIEGALDKSLSRSDDQLAYYVAQAREIIDLSIMSQREVVAELQRTSGHEPALVGEA